jgi:hypothetical protein
MTGCSSRTATFGPVWDAEKGELGLLTIPFGEFVFPACTDCNTAFSSLEARAQDVVGRMLSEEALQASDFSTLLSWLDKVRIGMWLAFYFLQKNLANIDPHMAIGSRVDRSDRLVYIFRSEESAPGVHIIGANTPAFQYLPASFAIIMNGLGLLNVSTDFLFSRRLGLPYAAKAEWGDFPLVEFEIAPPRDRVMLPLLRGNWDADCTRIYQPMAGRPEIRAIVAGYSNSSAVRHCFRDLRSGVGTVFAENQDGVGPFTDVPTRAWIPPARLNKRQLAADLTRTCLPLQLRLMNEGPAPGSLNEEHRRIITAQRRYAATIAALILEALD